VLHCILALWGISRATQTTVASCIPKAVAAILPSIVASAVRKRPWRSIFVSPVFGRQYSKFWYGFSSAFSTAEMDAFAVMSL
jgi:hypothetical protein